MKKNNLDERQEQELLHIEHNGCWLAFWLLASAIVLQVLMGTYLDHILGEVITLAVISMYILISCLRRGIWDRKLKPNLRTNLPASLTAGLFMGFFRYATLSGTQEAHPFQVSLLFGSFVFILSLGALSLCTFLYKRRAEKLEQE